MATRQSLTEETLVVEQVERTFLLQLPAQAPQPWPVVIALHGGGTNATFMARFCRLHELAVRAGFAVVYPQGTGRVAHGRTWNAGGCCGYAQRHQIDDVRFIDRLIQQLIDQHAVDDRRIYATGMSNGGMLCYLLADRLAGRLAAIAPVAGVMMHTQRPTPRRPVPILHFHGSHDQYVPLGGGRGQRSRPGLEFPPLDQTLSAWRTANHCRPEASRRQLQPAHADGTWVEWTRWEPQPGGATVQLVTVHGAGHTWPGQPTQLKELGPSTTNISANHQMWAFFQQHTRSSPSV